MSVAGIVCEYNPFHRGHEYQIRKTREILGENTIIICVMSGDFVQRGEPALFSKYARAEAACLCGADLVAELPLPWALSSAEGFAAGAVSLLHKLGADYISFGSECGNISELEKIADAVISPEAKSLTSDYLNMYKNISYAEARQKALESIIGDSATIIEQPNNILAIEYIKAIKMLGININPLTVERKGAAHDSKDKNDGFASASEIRRMIEDGEDFSDYIPEKALEIIRREIRQGRIIDRDRIDTAMLSRLRMMKSEDFEKYKDGENGLGNRIFDSVMSEATIEDIAQKAKTKRYAYSRIKRLCVRTALNVMDTNGGKLPQYARILAANDRGLSVLKSTSKDLTIITKPAAARKITGEIGEMSVNGAYAHDLYVLGYKAKQHRKGGEDWKTSPVIVHFT